MTSPTTKLQTPTQFVINNGTKDLTYEIALKNIGTTKDPQYVRQWRKTKVRIQPGEGELVKHWDSWHSGMGYSRDESRDAQYAPPVYESGAGVACRRGYLYPAFAVNTIAVTTTITVFDRIAEMGGYIYVFGRTGSGIAVFKVDPADQSIVYERTFTGGQPAGQSVEFGGYLYLSGSGTAFKELTTICGDLTAAWYYNGTTYTNNTSNAASSGGTAFTLLADHTDDIFYFGAATQFDGVYFDITTAAGSALTMDWEYWNGAAWTDIVSETDGTTGLTVDGWVTWASASQTGWAAATPTATSMGGTPPDDVSRYWVRVKTTTATPWTAPTATWLPISDVWTDGPSTRKAWHLGTAGKLLWRVGDSSATPKHYVVNSCAAVSSGGSGGPLTAANWSDSADYVIGKPGRNINSIVELGRWPYFGKEEGLIGSDTEGNQTNALDFTRSMIVSTNCSDSIRWLGTLVTVHKSGLWQHTGVTSRLIGVETLKGNNSAIKGGRYTALATTGEWLYVAYYVGGSTYLLAVRPGAEDEPLFVWHHLETLATTYVPAMHISSLPTNPTLYLGAYTSAPRYIKYITLAADGSIDPADSAVTFQAQANNLDLPAVDWGIPGTPKHGHMVEIVTSQAKGTGGTVGVYYGWDGATPSTQLGADITTVGKHQRFWAGGNTQGTHWGYRPQVRAGVTGHASNVLRVEKVSLYCAARPRKEPIITVIIRCGDNLDRLRDAKTMYDDLEALENAGVYLVRDPDDPLSGTFYAIVENVDEHKGEQLADYSGERLLSVTLRVVEYA